MSKKKRKPPEPEPRIVVNAIDPHADFYAGPAEAPPEPEPESIVVTLNVESEPARVLECRRCGCRDIRGVFIRDLPSGAKRYSGTCRHCGRLASQYFPAETQVKS